MSGQFQREKLYQIRQDRKPSPTKPMEISCWGWDMCVLDVHVFQAWSSGWHWCVCCEIRQSWQMCAQKVALVRGFYKNATLVSRCVEAHSTLVFHTGNPHPSLHFSF